MHESGRKPRAVPLIPFRKECAMAQRVRIELTDDLLNDGTTADETVTFSLDGVSYEVDLSTANAAKLREDFAAWVGVARRVSGQRRQAGRPAAKRGTRSGASSANEIRAWARENGFEVSDRGRVRDEVRAAYEAAH